MKISPEFVKALEEAESIQAEGCDCIQSVKGYHLVDGKVYICTKGMCDEIEKPPLLSMFSTPPMMTDPDACIHGIPWSAGCGPCERVASASGGSWGPSTVSPGNGGLWPRDG